jgi:hypothetical protein
LQSPARDERIFLLSLAGLFHFIDAQPSHEWLGWLGYCHHRPLYHFWIASSVAWLWIHGNMPVEL